VPAHLITATEALASGALTRRDLRRRYTKVHRNVYAKAGQKLSALDKAHAAWLWSERRATLVGHSAAALLGSKWVPAELAPELVHSRRGVPKGITIRSNGIRDDEMCTVGAIRCTTPARTAYDLGRRLPFEEAVIRVDALLNATGVQLSEVEQIALRYPGARGIRDLRHVLEFADGGAESPQETRLRLLLVQSGLPRPQTQIPVVHGRNRRRIDMGWPEYLVGVEYDGEQHFESAVDYENDIDRLEFLAERGWTIVRVSARQLRFERPNIVARVNRALAKA
jgi:very-short-patch-repair endonuclease